MERLRPELLRILQTPSDDYSTKIVVPRLTVPISAELRESFRTSLVTHLFGWPEITLLRTRLSLADFIWVCHPMC